MFEVMLVSATKPLAYILEAVAIVIVGIFFWSNNTRLAYRIGAIITLVCIGVTAISAIWVVHINWLAWTAVSCFVVFTILTFLGWQGGGTVQPLILTYPEDLD